MSPKYKTKGPTHSAGAESEQKAAPAAPSAPAYRRWLIIAGCVAAMALIALAYFYPSDVQGDVLRQPDMMQGVANGQEVKAFAEATGETSWWTGSLFSGMPTFQISPTYASNALFGWINTVMGLGLPSPANLLFMMMIGMFILLMTMRMRWYVALMGAIGYGFSTYFIIIIGAGHIWKFVTLAYIPPTIAGLVLCYRGRYLAGGAVTALFTMMQIASNHVQMTYYFLFVIAGFVIAYLAQAIKEKKMRRWGIATAVAVAAAALGVVANLPSLYNTYEYSKYTIRGSHSELTDPNADPEQATSGLDRNYITQYSYGRSETFTLLIPNVKGGASAKPVNGQMVGVSLADLDDAKQVEDRAAAYYLQYFPQYFGEPEGTNGPVYVGALIFALFLLGCFTVKGPMKWALVTLTLLSIFLALGRNMMWLTDLMIDYMPMYSKFRTPESILVIAEFTMPLLAALGLQKALTEKDAWARHKVPVLVSFGVTLLICFIGMIAPGIFGSPVTERESALLIESPTLYAAIEALRLKMVQTDALRSFFIAALGFGVLLLYLRGKLHRGVAAAVVCMVVLVDLYSINKRYLSAESFVAKESVQEQPIPMTQADRTILQDTAVNYRVFDLPRFYQAAPSYWHKSLGGYHAAKLTRYQDLIDRHLGHIVAGDPIEADFNVANMLNARWYVLAADPENPAAGTVALYNDEALGNAWFVDNIEYVKGADAEMNALSVIDPSTVAVADESFAERLGSASPKAPGDTIYETSYAPNRLAYKARSKNGGLAVFSEVYFPFGWTATIDGEEVEAPGRVNYLLRALPIPAGEHEIVMTFDPPSVKGTVTAATIAIIIIYLALAAALGLVIKKKYFAGKPQAL